MSPQARAAATSPRMVLLTLTATLMAVTLLIGHAQAQGHGGDADRPPQADERPTAVQVAGQDRYATAAQAATEAFDDPSAVVVATGWEFADALAGSTLGGAVQAPVLLAPGELEGAALPDAVSNAIDELAPDTIYLLGGEGAISQQVAEALEEHADDAAIERVAGASRYETALEIALTAVEQDASAGEIDIDGDVVRAAFLGTGLDFPDSVAAGPAAFATGAPMLLTGPDELHEAAETALEELDVDHVIVLGGRAAVSDEVISTLEELGLTVERVGLEDRWATAAAIAERLEDEEFGFDAEHVGMVTGLDFADALAASSYLGSIEAPLVMGDRRGSDELPEHTAEYLEARGCEIRFLQFIGGDAAVGEMVREAALDLAACVGEEGEGSPGNGENGTPE